LRRWSAPAADTETSARRRTTKPWGSATTRRTGRWTPAGCVG
jgi:hypothetical protein